MKKKSLQLLSYSSRGLWSIFIVQETNPSMSLQSSPISLKAKKYISKHDVWTKLSINVSIQNSTSREGNTGLDTTQMGLERSV